MLNITHSSIDGLHTILKRNTDRLRAEEAHGTGLGKRHAQCEIYHQVQQARNEERGEDLGVPCDQPVVCKVEGVVHEEVCWTREGLAEHLVPEIAVIAIS